MKNLILLICLLISIVFSNKPFNSIPKNFTQDTNHIKPNNNSDIKIIKPKLEEIYDDDEFDTTGVDIDSLDLTNVNTGIRNPVNIKPSEDINIPKVTNKHNQENKNSTPETNLKSINIASNLENMNINADHHIRSINDLNEPEEYNGMNEFYDDDLKMNNMQGVETNSPNALQEIGGPRRKGRSRRGMGGHEFMGRHGNIGGQMGGYGHMGDTNMNNFQNYNNNRNIL